jgi:hypothetical protein
MNVIENNTNALDGNHYTYSILLSSAIPSIRHSYFVLFEDISSIFLFRHTLNN